MNNSRVIISNQSGIHEKLEAVVRRHLNSRFQRPMAAHSVESFAIAQQRVEPHGGPVILDSFCGVGESTARLADLYPDALVIGVDKSAHRLAKHDNYFTRPTNANYLLLQADVEDFWRLALEQQWPIQRHCLFYPNPWPKSSQLKRRVHGSPLFATLLALGGTVELRSNWPIYVEEFAAALQLAGQHPARQQLEVKQPITPFERKYQQSGQALWQCIATLTSLD
ncbi:MAG: tRNA G46 methylase TrmB [Oceanicoccus sp.]|jgi:tRNA G46 methylase TrmB